MIYLSSSCIRKSNIAEVVTLYGERGIKNIELSGGTYFYEGIEDDLRALSGKYDLTYACHAYFPPPREPFVVNLASCNDKIYRQSIEHYEKCIRMLKRIDCKFLSVHAGFMVEVGANEIGRKLSSGIVYEEDSAYERFCNAYEHILKECTKNGIELYLENNVLSAENYEEFEYHNYLMMTDYSSILKMREKLDFNLLLDLGHLHVSAQTLRRDFRDECSRLKKYVKWIHISENNGISDEHKPLKAGSEILEEFHKVYVQGLNVTLETIGNIEDILESMKLIKRTH